jgi:hypothetical protein
LGDGKDVQCGRVGTVGRAARIAIRNSKVGLDRSVTVAARAQSKQRQIIVHCTGPGGSWWSVLVGWSPPSGSIIVLWNFGALGGVAL